MAEIIAGTFEIEDSFKITGRGLVILGDIVEGTVSVNNYVTFNDGLNEIKLRIKGVEIAHGVGGDRRISKLGLLF